MSDTEQHPSGDLVFYIGERSAVHGATQVLLLPAPPVVGHWVIGKGFGGDLTVDMHRRPRWILRWAMRVVFDIHWRDA